ncbi:RecQ family ATP-dependent DNA helicase [uncultured Brevibacterium sp.]|uniref:RecQ family ATP-dependent DNA helicase n=1 Tax=uncultured Brevibacterium sp. TaxID=189678 RepID=UPI0025E031CF|nr:RecQ family ATP-dependent DNA helicase [uncultured Brevibacterium sp.]
MDSSELRTQALSALRELTGRPDAEFHPGQFEAIEALVAGRRRTLVVQRTGWGKSAVYFVAARLLRAAGRGPSLIISPLLALMRDQVGAAERAGVRAVTLNSSNVTEWDSVLAALGDGAVDVLLISPERLNNPKFRDHVLQNLLTEVGMIVVDEAHCISDWGHDFRPDYRRIGALLAELPADLPVLATTATANERVVADVAEQLGADTLVIRGPLSRASLRLGVAPVRQPSERIAWLGERLGDFPGSGIIYTLTVAAAQDTARALRSAGWDVAAYTGGTDPEERERLEGDLKANRLKALVATSALGMGFDKPDLGFVVHLGAPSSPVAYYQQVGRAGRATESADVLLLPGAEDSDIWEYFATASMPAEDDAAAVLAALTDVGGEPLSVPRLETLVGVKRARLDLLLKTLQVDGAVDRVAGGFVSTGRGWTYDAERYANVAAARKREAQAMLDYEATGGCRMRFLAEQLDDPEAADCGRCDTCAGQWWSDEVSDSGRSAARSVLSAVGLPVEPRASWPSGLPSIGVDLKGRIPESERSAVGRVVARLTDLGPGQLLRGFLAPGAEDLPVPPEIGAHCLRVLADWGWDARPEVVVSIPNARRPTTVASLAAELARVGRLHEAGPLTARRETGSPDVNSAFRVRDVHDAFAVSPELAAAVEGRTVLLVDDEIVSRWTMTAAARELRRAGAAAVLPFALALRA